jgi:putative transposase
VVWCPKYRRPVLADRVKDRCAALIRANVGENGWQAVALEIMPDYVRLSVKAHPADSPWYVTNQVKGFTSRMLRRAFPYLRSGLSALWSRSLFATTAERYLGTQYERPWRTERQR